MALKILKKEYRIEMQYLKSDVATFNATDLQRIRAFEQFLSDENSDEYINFYDFLSGRHQKSYLSKGFVKAALPYFYEFVENQHIR